MPAVITPEDPTRTSGIRGTEDLCGRQVIKADHSSRLMIYLFSVELLDLLAFFTTPVIVFGRVSPRILSRHATISEM